MSAKRRARLARLPIIRPMELPTTHCHRMVIRIHSLILSAVEEYFRAAMPMYRKGKETPSLQADSALKRSLIRFGTRSEKRDLERTLAARTGSVGERQAPIISAVGMDILKMRKAKRAVIAQEKVMIGPRKYSTDFQCLLK